MLLKHTLRTIIFMYFIAHLNMQGMQKKSTLSSFSKAKNSFWAIKTYTPLKVHEEPQYVPNIIDDIFNHKNGLHEAVQARDITVLKQLLQEKNLDINQEDKYHRTPLYYAVRIDENDIEKQNDIYNGSFYENKFKAIRYQIIELLLQRGANTKNGDYLNPLFYNYEYYRYGKGIVKLDKKALELLLDYNPNPNIQDFESHTCLYYAILLKEEYGNTIIEMLLQKDADPTILDDKGKSILDYAFEKKHSYYSAILKHLRLFKQKKQIFLLMAHKRKECIISKLPRRLLLYVINEFICKE